MSALCVSLFLLSDTEQSMWIGQHLIQEDLLLDNIISTLLPDKVTFPGTDNSDIMIAFWGKSSTSDSILTFQQNCGLSAHLVPLTTSESLIQRLSTLLYTQEIYL